MLMISEYPLSDSQWINEEAEPKMQFIQEVIIAVRNLRSEMNVPPMKLAEIVFIGDEARYNLLNDNIGYLATLARVDRVIHSKEKPRPASSAIVHGTEIFLPLGDLIDLNSELTRLEKERSRLDERVKGFKKKLSDDNFILKAPDSVVEREKEKLMNSEKALTKLLSNIELLS